jgi:hypothetical protein
MCLMAKALQDYHGIMRYEDLVTATKALALLCASEDFQTYKVGRTCWLWGRLWLDDWAEPETLHSGRITT